MSSFQMKTGSIFLITDLFNQKQLLFCRRKIFPIEKKTFLVNDFQF